MKSQLLVIYLFAFLLFGCNSSSTEKKEMLENDSISQEKMQMTDEENSETKEAEPIDKNYLIANKSAGKFKIGKQIPFPTTSDNYKIKKETHTRMTEEGEEEETMYIVNENNIDLLNIKPGYSDESGAYSKNIEEIIILSEKFKTLDGIGVHSTIQDFIKVYPNYTIWYTYVSGMYVIETKGLNAQFILNEKDFIGKLNVTSDMITLKNSDFKPSAKIIKIRIE